MLERYLESLRTDDPGAELPAATRERLKPRFAPGAARRMTLLGMMVGASLHELLGPADDSIVYSSSFGEGTALEGFLESFPTPSPTLFQTSIHPSAVQQALIGRQRALPELLPLAGGPELVAQAALAALPGPAESVLWCGGEERGMWLCEAGLASDRSFAFALALTRARPAAPLARLALEISDQPGALALPAWFDLLHARRAWSGAAGGGWHLRLEWL
jgi:hypothetical protein